MLCNLQKEVKLENSFKIKNIGIFAILFKHFIRKEQILSSSINNRHTGYFLKRRFVEEFFKISLT